MLSWSFDGVGSWEAYSSLTNFVWRIAVCDDGTFCVNESDSELTDCKDTFCGLEAAQKFCQHAESGLSQEASIHPLALNVARANARASFRQWNDVANRFEPGTGSYSEILGVIDDAVEYGWNAACDNTSTETVAHGS